MKRHLRNSQLLAIFFHGSLLTAFFLYFRFEKMLALRLSLTWWDRLCLLLPELGAVLILEAILLAAAWLLRHGWQRKLWWVLFSLLHLAAYAGGVTEHSVFLLTGIRLNPQLLEYTWNNLAMLSALIAFGITGQLISRFLIAALLFLLGALLHRLGNKRLQKAPVLSRPLHLAAGLVAAGLVLLHLPQSETVRNSDLASSTLHQLVSRPGDPEEAALHAQPFRLPPEEIYQRPEIRRTSERLTEENSALEKSDSGETTSLSAASENSASPTEQEPVTANEGAIQPNIVLVLLESTRADAVAPYSPQESWSQTPNLATLAADGWVFENAYGSVTHTSKALVAILCGMFPRPEMRIHETLEGNLPLACLPHLLKEGGYRTAFLQTALGEFENRPGLVRNLGFDQAAFQETLSSQGFSTTGYLGMDEMAMVEPARQWTTRGGPQPFFLTLLTVSPHHPYQVPGMPLADLEDLSRSYLAALHHQDKFVGEIVGMLTRAGLLDNTVIIALGDHGEAFGEHSRMQHDMVPYEESIRVPLIVRAPRILGEAKRISGLHHQLDLLPSILDLAHLDWEGKLPGKSFLDASSHDRTFTSCWFTDTCIAMREGDRKFIFHFGLRPTEVFDLRQDPGETRNLAESLDPAVIQEAEGRIVGWKMNLEEFWQQHPTHDGPTLWWRNSSPQSP